MDETSEKFAIQAILCVDQLGEHAGAILRDPGSSPGARWDQFFSDINGFGIAALTTPVLIIVGECSQVLSRDIHRDGTLVT